MEDRLRAREELYKDRECADGSLNANMRGVY